jgi:hypothetical protein
MAAGDLHSQTAENQDSGIQEQNGGELDGVPVADEFLRPGVEVADTLMGHEDDGHGEHEHEVPGEDKADHAAAAFEQFARARAAEAIPFVVVAIAAATSRTAIYGWFATDARVFPLGINRIARKGTWHGR